MVIVRVRGAGVVKSGRGAEESPKKVVIEGMVSDASWC